jgi:hypothetical protein
MLTDPLDGIAGCDKVHRAQFKFGVLSLARHRREGDSFQPCEESLSAAFSALIKDGLVLVGRRSDRLVQEKERLPGALGERDNHVETQRPIRQL